MSSLSTDPIFPPPPPPKHAEFSEGSQYGSGSRLERRFYSSLLEPRSIDTKDFATCPFRFADISTFSKQSAKPNQIENREIDEVSNTGMANSELCDDNESWGIYIA